jgi:hypothetical protein
LFIAAAAHMPATILIDVPVGTSPHHTIRMARRD